jgi:hypothetical protein
MVEQELTTLFQVVLLLVLVNYLEVIITSQVVAVEQQGETTELIKELGV